MSDNIKKSEIYKQNKIRAKIEKLNKSELYTLQRKLKVIDRERDHYNAMVIRHKKEITFHLKDVQKNSGHSIMGLEPDRHDKAIRESPLFNTGIILSEKQFMSWRLKEKSVQQRYRIKELELKKELEKEQSLVQLLKNLNIITEKFDPFKLNEDEEHKESESRLHHADCEYPYINKMLKRRQNTNEMSKITERPRTVDCASIRREYIERVTTPVNLKNVERKISSILNKDFHSSSVPHVLPPQRRSKSAKPEKTKRLLSDETINQKPPRRKVSIEKVTEVISRPKNLLSKESNQQDKTQNDDMMISGFAKMPKWKRQLLMEAPVGLNDEISKVKVQVIMSQSQKRKDLEELIDNNKADLEKITKEKQEEKKRAIETMQKTLKEIDELDEQNIEVEF